MNEDILKCLVDIHSSIESIDVHLTGKRAPWLTMVKNIRQKEKSLSSEVNTKAQVDYLTF